MRHIALSTTSSHVLTFLLTACICMLGVVLPVLSQPTAAASRVNVELDESWTEVEAIGLAQRRFVHSTSGAVLQIIVIEAPEDETIKDDEGNTLPLTGSLIAADWEQQFVDGGPLVEVLHHDKESRGGIQGTFADMTWNGRRGMFFGFSSAGLAAAHGVPISHDRFAYFILCEGPGDEKSGVDEVCGAVYANFSVTL